MPSDTDLPTLKARLRDLLERATPRPWKAGRHGGEIAAAGLPHEPQVALACGQAAMNDERSSTPEVQRANAELITAAVNALPALLDELDRAESESALCKRFAEQNVEELNADELREYAIGLGERVARNEREMADANGRLRAELGERRALDADVVACAEQCRNILIGHPGMPAEDMPLAPCALAARRILAAKDAGVIGGEGSLRAGCPIDHPGTACQQDCPEHCREGAFELNVGDDLEPPGPGECRYCGMAVQHKLQCPGWPGQRVEPGHAEEHGFTPGELKTGGDAPVPTPARPAPWPLGDDDV